MKEIVVISGKGGTGKTSITASLAYFAGKDGVLADCDVDASDLHLLLNPDIQESSDFFSGLEAKIDPFKCTGCGKCEEVCRFDAVHREDEKSKLFKVNPISCEGCGYCARICPAKAIEMNKSLSGKLYKSLSRFESPMVHAKLGIGAENSGKLVAEVKSVARKTAEEFNKELIIVDGSPGIGCPVVSSLSNANFVVMVTEPSVSGIHDLKRIFEVVSRFSIPCGVIINKFDINLEKSSELKEYLELNNIEELGRLPYSKEFPKAITNGITVAETDNGTIKSKLEVIWNFINNLTNSR